MRLHFGEFCLDTDRRELSEGGLIHLTPKALQLLRLLIEQRPRALAKEEIHEHLWPGTYVDESNLSVLVAEVRKALREDARKPRFIRTAHGFGYGFIGEVRSDAPVATIRLRHGTRELELLQGENIIGRDTAARVRLSSPGISRQHARITVAGPAATIEDLGSKNGTYVQGRRIQEPTALRQGDEILVSREVLVVLDEASSATTITEVPAEPAR